MAEIPQELVNKTYEAFNAASSTGKVKKGTNEVTKSIERGKAKLVAVAKDVSPPEIIAHIPILCKERDIPLVEVPKKDELGKAAGLTVPTASVAIVEPGEGKKTMEDLVKKINDLGKGPSSKKEEPKEKKEEPKEEKEEQKEEKASKAKEKEEKKEKKEEKSGDKAEDKKE